MSSAVPVVLLATVMFVSSTVAIAPCSDVIIQGFSLYKECYAEGEPPVQKYNAEGQLGSVILYSKEELTSDVQCVTFQQNDSHGYFNFHYFGKFGTSAKYDNDYHTDHITVTTDDGTKFRMYVILNENGVYSFYTCLAEGGESSGTHAVYVVVNCNYLQNAIYGRLEWGGVDSLAVVERTKKCFNLLNITNVVPLSPCNCWLNA